MSEKSLNNVLRQMRMAAEFLNMAKYEAEDLLQDHIVASDIGDLEWIIRTAIQDYDTVYRVKHYG